MDTLPSSLQDDGDAPGQPGVSPTWTSSAKSGVGTALGDDSNIWFSTSHGILNEIYFQRLDMASTRDMGMIVTDGQDFFSEEKRDTQHETTNVASGVPAFRFTNTCLQKRYTIDKLVFADPMRESLIQHTQFKPLRGGMEDYHLYVLLAPHLGNTGSNNTAWVGQFKGVTMLFAQREGLSLALACSSPWKGCSVGFVGTSDGWQDLNRHKEMTWHYTRAESGNVALTGEIDLGAANGEFTLAVGFGTTPGEAGHRALATLLTPVGELLDAYTRAWEDWHRTLLRLEPKSEAEQDFYSTSMSVLRTHEAKNFPGAFIASLSIPWGEDKGGANLGGYHLVWPRDLIETAGGLLAGGAAEDLDRVFHFLRVTQEPDGHWPQNMWLDGTPYWRGMQEDETALPIILVELARADGHLSADDRRQLWPMVRRAAGFIVRTGPVTDQDRWEEDAGYTAFTLAAEVAALLCAADLADEAGEAKLGIYLRETADIWNDNIEHWTYAKGTDLARQVGVEGYYVRIAPSSPSGGASLRGTIEIKNRPGGGDTLPATSVVSADALALVRFGLRCANDPHVLNTLKVIDALLKTDTPYGPAWHRYNDDGYGEQADGSPYDGVGIGRAWPLLTGERAHYELAAGRKDEAERLLHTMESFANAGGLISEQVWDSEDIPDKNLYCGKPSGSAMPLVWAHAEYVKLLRSIRDNRIFDMPHQTKERYLDKQTPSLYASWKYNNKIRGMVAGKTLRIEVHTPATIHWSTDGWRSSYDTDTRDTGIDIHIADLPTEDLEEGGQVAFTLYWKDAGKWEGIDFSVSVH